MADVARHAGVSAMTVSRALKDETYVSPATRERILAAVDELGYVLDQAAGSLSSKRTGFVAALVPSINNSNFSDTTRGMSDALAKRGIQLLLGFTDYSIENEERLIEVMLKRRPEGIIITGGTHSERARKLLNNAAIPVVETWDLPRNPIDSVVGFSNANAARLMVETLAKKGYRKLGFIGGTTNRDTRGDDRRFGFLEAVEELSLPADRLVSFGAPPITMLQGGEAMVQMLDRWPDTEAVMCVSDLSAFGSIMECQRRGWKVPERIAIAGFGNFEVAECSVPSITTIKVDCYGIGYAAAEKVCEDIVAMREGGSTTPQTVAVDIEIVERESA
ncbi:MAG: LacI family DNA-binding transcriptional regulator [Pseudomonadota bacterium]